MAIYIEIKKISTHENIHYYKVATQDFEIDNPVCIGIDAVNNLLHIYMNNILNKPICTINFDNPKSLACDNISSGLMIRIFSSALDALRKNEFGEYISYCS